MQLLSINWNRTQPDFSSECRLTIHWWGQSPSENLVLLIPNGSCPPSVTTIYPLVSSRNHIYRYFQDMVALDFCLVVGMQSGIKMGSFSMDIGRLSDNHPIESTIPVIDGSGVQLASTTVRVSLLYGPETPTASDTKFHIPDAPAVNVITNFKHELDDFPARVNLLPDVEAPAESVGQMGTTMAPRYSRKQLILDVELPRKSQPMLHGHICHATNYHLTSSTLSSPRLGIFSDEFSPSPNHEEAIISSEECPSLPPESAQKSEEERDAKVTPATAESSVDLSGPQSPYTSPIRSRGPKRRAVNGRSGHPSAKTSSRRKGGEQIARIDKCQPGKTTTDYKRPKTSKPGKVSPKTFPDIHTESSSERSYKVIQNSPEQSAITSKIHASGPKTPPRSNIGLRSERPETKAKLKKSSKRSRPREEEEKVQMPLCNIHYSSSEAEKSNVGYRSVEDDLVKTKTEQKQLVFFNRHRLSGNLAILPRDRVDGYLDGISGCREPEDSLCEESVEELIEKITAFRATLKKSSVAWAHMLTLPVGNGELDKTKSKTLVKPVKQVDETGGVLSSILTENNEDLPRYARVAQTEILEDDPKDVAEAALVEELFFPTKEAELKGCSIRETRSPQGPKPSTDICEIHKEGTQKKHVFVDSLPLRYCEGTPTVSRSDSAKPHLEYLCVHDVCKKPSDNIYASDLRLNLNVGKMIISESTMAKFRRYSQNLSEKFVARCKPPSCLLTISFPGLNLSDTTSVLAPEQSITLSPTRLESSELLFGNVSQLHWKHVKMQSLEMWKSERVIIRALLSWDDGQSLTCAGSILVEEVLRLMPKAFQTNLVLVRERKRSGVLGCETARLSMTEPEAWTGPESGRDEVSDLMAPVDGTPAAKLEISIELLVEDSSRKAMTGDWLYVTVSCVTGSKFQPDDETTGQLLLIVKSDVQNICRIPFYADWKSSPGHEVKAWRPLKGSHPDGVLRGPKETNIPILFIEVWRKPRGSELTLAGYSDNLIGLVKVPLKSSPNITKGNEGSLVVAEGDYYIWNPYKDVLCGALEVRIATGSEAQMLELLQQNRAARIIQSHAYSLMDGSQTISSVVEDNPLTNSNLPTECETEMVKHVIEVTVQHATDLPQSAVFAKCEGTFIKYLFPGDEEAFYTQTMEWRKTIHFSASVHHGIILPTDQRLETRFKMTDESKGNLIFELWGCYASLSDEEIYPPNVLKLSDSGVLDAWDMGREPTCTHPKWGPERQERLIGTAKLFRESLCRVILSKTPCSSEVRKRFFLPIHLEQSLLNGGSIQAPILAVEVTYFILNEERLNEHLQNTIFSKVNISEDSLFEGVVEFDIIGAAGLQNAEERLDPSSAKYFRNGLNSFVRYSLFHGSRELSSKYPPSQTPVQPNNCSPQYNWTGRFKIDLNVQVLEELKKGHMSFDVWHHHFPQTRRNMKPIVPTKDSLSTDILLGTTVIPTRMLLESRQGIEGWHDLISRKGEKIGAINVEVYFKHWQVRPLEFITT